MRRGITVTLSIDSPKPLGQCAVDTCEEATAGIVYFDDVSITTVCQPHGEMAERQNRTHVQFRQWP